MTFSLDANNCHRHGKLFLRNMHLHNLVMNKIFMVFLPCWQVRIKRHLGMRNRTVTYCLLEREKQQECKGASLPFGLNSQTPYLEELGERK